MDMGKSAAVAAVLFFVGPTTLLAGGNPILGEVELSAATRIEKNAGVWVDGQYMGYVRELKGNTNLVLMPGEHQIVIKLAGYADAKDTIVVEPGQKHQYRVELPSDPEALYPDKAQTARLRISVRPATAAVFINDVFAGHVDRFNGRKGARLRAGTHRVKIALPGYRSFETELVLIANQTYEIKTELPAGSITDQAEPLTISQLAE